MMEAKEMIALSPTICLKNNYVVMLFITQTDKYLFHPPISTGEKESGHLSQSDHPELVLPARSIQDNLNDVRGGSLCVPLILAPGYKQARCGIDISHNGKFSKATFPAPHSVSTLAVAGKTLLFRSRTSLCFRMPLQETFTLMVREGSA
jgi:hypothetical protein